MNLKLVKLALMPESQALPINKSDISAGLSPGIQVAVDNSNLDLLRTLAVCDVVGFHLLLFFKKGNLGSIWAIGRWGVLLFFIHTSLVLMLSLERQEQKLAGTNIFWPFYIRRIFRILPLSMLVVTLIGIFNLPVGHLIHGDFQAVHLGTLGFISNLLLLQSLTGTESITAPLWSLPYEMQMYLILPVIYVLIRHTRSMWLTLGIWLAGTLAAYTADKAFHAGYPSFIMLVPCFIAGIVGYQVSKTSSFRMPFVAFPITIALASFYYLRKPSPAHSWMGCLIVGLFLLCFREAPYQWVRKACHTVAQYSYGIYLTHFACIWFAFVALGGLPLGLRWVIFAAAAAGVPVILYHTVEAPLISVGHQIVNKVGARSRAWRNRFEIT
jgi:peptidoglycan/LPS O-acetylase OafA/YrhL